MLQIVRKPVAIWQQDTAAAVANEWRGAYGFCWLNVSEPSDELGPQSSVVLKLVLNTRGKHLDLIELLWTGQWNFGFRNMLRISLKED